MAGRTRGKDAIYSVVSDDSNVICHTEATLDAWWNSLVPEDKGALYELHLEGALEPELPVMTSCGVSPRAMSRPEFVASLAELATASRIMIQAREFMERPDFPRTSNLEPRTGVPNV
jgi:hypothetical protein